MKRRLDRRYTFGYLLVLFLVSTALGQKTKIGYDKSVDFSRYKTFSTLAPETAPTKPLLYSTISNSIYQSLKAKHIQEFESGGDLLLVASGGIGVAQNASGGTPISSTYSGPPLSYDATMWTGAEGPSGGSSVAVQQGSLTLTFIDPGTHKIVWSGTVIENLDIEQKNDSLKRVDRAVAKLLSKFPPSK